MAGSVAVQVAREEVFESFSSAGGDGAGFEQPCQQQQRSLLRTNFSVETRVDVVATAVEEDSLVADGPTELAAGVDEKVAGGATEARGPAMTVQRHSLLAPYKPGKMTVVLDMDECLLHSKFHGPGAASEAYRQLEERPDAVNEVNSFWVALDDGDTAQVNKRPGLDPFLEALARDYNTIVFTAAMPDYAGPVLDYIDPKGTLFHQRLYRSSCRQVKGAFLKDLTVLGLETTDMSRTLLVDNNPLSFICQPTNGVLVASFYDDPNDTALASVMQLIRHLDHAGDVRPILKDMFRLDTLLCEYRNALFDDDEEEEQFLSAAGLAQQQQQQQGSSCCDDDLDDEDDDLDDDGDDLLLSASSTDQETEMVGMRSGKEHDVSKDCLDSHEDGDGLKDDDDESVKTEACSEESGESEEPSSLTAGEEDDAMELDLEF